MPALHFTIQIDGDNTTIFALLADLTQYDSWLSRSSTFNTTIQVSGVPVAAGTTYIDGFMRGSVTEHQPPVHIAFQQSRPIKLLFLSGVMNMGVSYRLETVGRATRVERVVSFDTHGIPSIVHPIIAGTIRRESQRLLLALKRYVET